MGKDKKKKTKLSKEDKKNLTRCSVLLMASLVNLTVASVAWFTSNKENDIKPNRFDSKGVPFELAAEGSQGVYDKVLSDDLKNGLALTDDSVFGENGMKTDDDNITSGTISVGNGKIRWVMSADSNFSNVKKQNNVISPGTSGKLEFYVVPYEEGNYSMDFDLILHLYDDEQRNINKLNSSHMFDSSYRVQSITSVHLLFFKQRSEADDGTFRYKERLNCGSDLIMNFSDVIEDAEVKKGYKYTVYWVWPDLMGQLILDDDTMSTVLSNKCSPVFAEEDEKEEFISELKNNYSHYFYGYRSNDPDYEFVNCYETEDADEEENIISTLFTDEKKLSDIIEKVSLGLFQLSDPNNDYSKLSYFWNKADQFVGVSVSYITAEIEASATVE